LGRSPFSSIGDGTMFQITTNGDFTHLFYIDSAFGKPSLPLSGVTRGLDGNYYGVAQLGAGNYGGLFSVRPIEAPVLQAELRGDQVCLKWKAFGGCFYILLYKTELDDPVWHGLPQDLPIPQSNGIMSYSEPVGLDSQRFYQVILGIEEHQPTITH
jgi:hypothetical protein